MEEEGEKEKKEKRVAHTSNTVLQYIRTVLSVAATHILPVAMVVAMLGLDLILPHDRY